jgi:hypothetical protein
LRAIRRQLVEMDWDWPRIPQPEPGQRSEEPLRLEIDLGELKGTLGRRRALELEPDNANVPIPPSKYEEPSLTSGRVNHLTEGLDAFGPTDLRGLRAARSLDAPELFSAMKRQKEERTRPRQGLP